MTGKVYLVGAGPGDPALLTLRALELMAAADVVAHDDLIPAAVLERIPPGVERLSVGRRHGTRVPSYRLHPHVLVLARAGKRVVRLKAGDPFVFGRGGEEMEDLAAAGVPFEVVPGVTAAMAAAAALQIPLTHRGCASDVAFASGHDADGSHASHTDWNRLAAASGTIVLYMAGRKLADNVRRLVAAGRAPETPAAYVASAARPEQAAVFAPLCELPDRVRGVDPRAPAIVIVGEVVARRAGAGREGAA